MNPIPKKLQAKNGFTLIELLLYVAIVSVLVFTIAALFMLIFQTRVKNQTVASVEAEGDLAIGVITQTIRNASTVTVPAVGSSGASLTLTVSDGTKSPTVFDLSGGRIRITEGAGTAVNLTSSRVNVTLLNFQNLSRSSTPNTVRVTFTADYINSSGRNEYSFTQNFYGSGSLRR